MEDRVRRKCELILAVLAECATALPRDRIDIEASLRIPGILIVNGQKPMPLRTDIANLKQDIGWQFALDRKVVLCGILRPHIRWKLSEQQNRSIKRPVHRLIPRRG